MVKQLIMAKKKKIIGLPEESKWVPGEYVMVEKAKDCYVYRSQTNTGKEDYSADIYKRKVPLARTKMLLNKSLEILLCPFEFGKSLNPNEVFCIRLKNLANNPKDESGYTYFEVGGNSIKLV